MQYLKDGIYQSGVANAHVSWGLSGMSPRYILEREIYFHYAVAVDGFEVILHGDDMVSCLAPFRLTTGTLCEVGMVTGIIVGHEHKCGSPVCLIAHAIVVHGAVAATVAKRQDGDLAYLLRDLQHLIGFQVLDDEFVGTHKVFLLAHGIIDTGLGALTGGHEFHVHANDAVRLDADALHQRTADEAVGATDDIIGKAVVFHDFGIGFCSTGNGMAIATNRHPGIRATVCWEPKMAKNARRFFDANVLCLPAGSIAPDKALEVLQKFCETEFEGGRYERRINKLSI